MIPQRKKIKHTNTMINFTKKLDGAETRFYISYNLTMSVITYLQPRPLIMHIQFSQSWHQKCPHRSHRCGKSSPEFLAPQQQVHVAYVPRAISGRGNVCLSTLQFGVLARVSLEERGMLEYVVVVLDCWLSVWSCCQSVLEISGQM